MTFMWDVEFWKKTAELAVRGAALAALLVIGGDQMNVFDADWAQVGGFALGGAVISVLMSLGSSPFGAKGPTILGGK